MGLGLGLIIRVLGLILGQMCSVLEISVFLTIFDGVKLRDQNDSRKYI